MYDITMETPENLFQKRRNVYIKKYIERINNFLILKYVSKPIIYEFTDLKLEEFNLFKKDLFDILKKHEWYVKELEPYCLNFKDYIPYAMIEISHKEIV